MASQGHIALASQIAFSTLTLLVGQQEEHPAHENGHGYLSGAKCKWLQYGPADATATPSSLHQKIQNGLSFWYRPTQAVLEIRPLNDCVCVCVCALLTHINTHLMTFFSRTTRVGWYQKDKQFWIILKQRRWGGSAISWTTCKSFAPRSRQITTPVFMGWMLFLLPNQQHQSTECNLGG